MTASWIASRIAFPAALFVSAAASIWGAAVKTWEVDDYRDFLPGNFENVALEREGYLTLAPELASVYESGQAAVWCAALSPDGSVYLGTGHEGKLIRVSAAGKAEVVWQAPEIEIFALAAAPDGDVYAATSPKGKVYRVSPGGEAESLFDPKAEYIWSLTLAAAGELYVGTGDEGKIFVVDTNGKGAEYYASGQRHVTSLAFDAEGRLLAGTDPAGLLYRIERQGKAFALYDSDLPEIRSILVDAEGAITLAAMGGGMSLAQATIPGVQAAFSVTATASAGAGSTPTQTTPTSALTAVTPAATAVQATPQIYYGGERSALVRISPDGSVDKIWSSKEEHVLGLTQRPTQGAAGELLFATDRSGRIYRLAGQGRVSLISETAKRQITALVSTENGTLAAAANSGGLFRLAEKPAAQAVYRVAVKDAGAASRWGRLSWEGEGKLELRTRSGNTGRPDASWSDWSDPIAGEDGGAVSSPVARYVQWEAKLIGAGPGEAEPRLDRVTLAYLPQNSAPKITAVEVGFDSSTSNGSTASSASAATDPTAAYSITVTADGSSSTPQATSTNQSTLGGNGGRKMSISWTVEDADGDELRAEVEFRGDGETAWKLLRKDVKEKKISVDSDAMADGRYRFRVRVTDAPSNPTDAAREAEKISAPTLIDHTPPLVRVSAIEGRQEARFEASDAASALVGAEYSVDAGEWQPLRSVDGLIDSRAEAFTIPLDELAEGERLVTLRVRDSAGNSGLAKAVIR